MPDETDAGKFEEWRPAIVKPFEINMEHSKLVLPPGVSPNPSVEERLRSAAGKRLLVRPVIDQDPLCPCGAVECEVETEGARAALPSWGSYGSARPTVCSELLYVD